MKISFTALLFFVAFNCIVQGVDIVSCASPFQCTRDLRNVQLPNIDSLVYSYAKSNSIPANFKDVDYSDGSECTPNYNCTNDTSQLKYKVYYPTGYNYSSCKLPMILLIHGGSFVDCHGSYLSPELGALCRAFAKRGFIAISADYRLGVRLVPTNKGDYYSAQQLLGIWRAGQDIRGAIRSIIQREINGLEPYRIDTSKIFIGGNSAGSVTAMNVAFYSKPVLLNAVLPSISDSNILGGINQNYYFGSTSINYTIKGVLDLWGGVIVPKNYLTNPEDFFYSNGNTLPPVIAFCGKKDPVFKYTHKDFLFPPSGDPDLATYLSENRCLNKSTATYTITAANSAPDGYLLGSQDIYDMLKRKSVLTEFYLDCDMGHGLDVNSDFGLSNPTEDNINEYFVERAATFFQFVISGTGTLSRTKFVECENARHQCSTTNDPSSCGNGNTCTN